MGDQGKLYVNEDVVPAYKALLRDADLILPNQFEAECVLTLPSHDPCSTNHVGFSLNQRSHGLIRSMLPSLNFIAPTASHT